MRYVGQSYEIETPLPVDAADPIAASIAEFHRRYRDLHGHGSLTEAIEFVNLRCVASCQPPAPLPGVVWAGTGLPPRGMRPVSFDSRQGYRDVAVYQRGDLGAGSRIEGPAIIEQGDTTTVIHPGQSCIGAASGSLVICWERRP